MLRAGWLQECLYVCCSCVVSTNCSPYVLNAILIAKITNDNEVCYIRWRFCIEATLNDEVRRRRKMWNWKSIKRHREVGGERKEGFNG